MGGEAAKPFAQNSGALYEKNWLLGHGGESPAWDFPWQENVLVKISHGEHQLSAHECIFTWVVEGSKHACNFVCILVFPSGKNLLWFFAKRNRPLCPLLAMGVPICTHMRMHGDGISRLGKSQQADFLSCEIPTKRFLLTGWAFALQRIPTSKFPLAGDPTLNSAE
jgi:hypothetical protein